MLNDSNVVRKFCRLFSLSVVNCDWENCKCRIWTPFVNKSDDNDVIERSKSYTDKDCMGDLISCNVERNDSDVVLGHSRKRPVNRDKSKNN